MGLESKLIFNIFCVSLFFISIEILQDFQYVLNCRGIATAISVYRGESGIREFVCAGAATGAMYKWQMGPRGWIVGGAFGMCLFSLFMCISVHS